MGIVYGIVAGIVLVGALVCTRFYMRRSREPSTPREAITWFREALQSPRAKWKPHVGDKHPEPDLKHDIGCFSFFPASRGSVSAKYDARGTSSRLEVQSRGSNLLIEYVKGEVSSFYFNGEKFDDVHPEVRLNKNLLSEVLRDIHRAVGFYVGKRDKKPDIREKLENGRQLDYGREPKKKRKKRVED